MDFMNYLSPLKGQELSLHKINKHFFGKDVIKIKSYNEIFDYLISPLEVILLRVETDDFENKNINFGEIIVVERTPLRIDGLAVVRLNGEMVIREIEHDKNFNTIIVESSKSLIEISDYHFFGTISYVLKSDEGYLLEMAGEELFRVLS